MTAIREPGKINADTTLIDAGMMGAERVLGVYVIKGEKACLIDSGTRDSVGRIMHGLKQIGVLVPDIVILTHSHWDHTQGIPALRKLAMKSGKKMDVMAYVNAIPNLADQSFNSKNMSKMKFDNITDVIPLQEGGTIDLGGITLRVYGTPGHMIDHIGILDEKNKNLFIGDALGVKVGDHAYISPCAPPLWDENGFFSTIQHLRSIPYETLSLSHFGCLTGADARAILDEALETYTIYKSIIEERKDPLNDVDGIVQDALKRTNTVVPDFKLYKKGFTFMLNLVNFFARMVRKKPIMVKDILIKLQVKTLIDGYLTSQKGA